MKSRYPIHADGSLLFDVIFNTYILYNSYIYIYIDFNKYIYIYMYMYTQSKLLLVLIKIGYLNKLDG